MTKRPKRVEAWAVVFGSTVHFRTHRASAKAHAGVVGRVIGPLVPHDPSAEAVVREAKAWAANPGSPRQCVRLRDAVERYERARKKPKP